MSINLLLELLIIYLSLRVMPKAVNAALKAKAKASRPRP